jgi:hypothetical protein
MRNVKLALEILKGKSVEQVRDEYNMSTSDVVRTLYTTLKNDFKIEGTKWSAEELSIPEFRTLYLRGKIKELYPQPTQRVEERKRVREINIKGKVTGTYPLEGGIPIPPRVVHRPATNWKTMKVGDSFFVPGKTNNFAASCYAVAKKQGVKITTRTSKDGVRIWRVS